MFTKGIILAAGLGTRMRPLTERIPKPLIEVAGKPLVDWAVDLAADAGIAVLVVNTSYKAEMVEEHIACHNAPNIIVSREATPLETGGGIANALALLGEQPFFAMNSDTICTTGTENPLNRLYDAWDETKMDALLLLHPRTLAIGYGGQGDFFLNEDGSLKRRGGEADAPYVFTGVQLLHPRLFDDAPEGIFSMNILYNRNLSRVHGLVHDGDWLHVGDVSGLAKAEAFLSQ
jgi:MurNAc alpha-1-phosphate uridylyltransferase